ncbi:ATP-dependent DNA helicase PIF1-like protein [Tanacetum coccineum]
MEKEWCHSHSSINLGLRILSKRKTTRQHNAPTVSEVAALIINDFGDGIPLISTTLLRGGQLFQQYLVDAYTTIDEQRLEWTRNNQDTLRVDLYHNLWDAVTRVVYVIEFQKRELPRAHILLWLEECCKCRMPGEIDDIISAELPSLMHDPDGDKVVTEYMLHGPYGKDATYAPCTTEGKCSKHFPKSFLPETVINEDGYPIYRRKDNKATAIKGARSFEAMMTVNKKQYATFKAACYAYGLLNDDKEWPHVISKASFGALGPQHRDLFVTILLLYDLTDEELRNYCLLEIQELLNRNVKSLTECQDLPQPNPKLLTNLYNRLIREALAFDMNKSIASLLLPGDRNAHSRFVIPLELMENSTCNIKQNTHLAELMQQVHMIIWDEAPMTQRYVFEALDKTLRDILGYTSPEKRSRIFGGMTMLLGGDFRQILPVIPKDKRLEVVKACINRSELWKYCKIFTLTCSMRGNEYSKNGETNIRKQTFNRWILAIGDGKLPAKTKEGEDEPTWIEIPEEFLIKLWNSPIEQIVSDTYPNFTTRQTIDEYLKERSILTPRNDDADAINEYMF